MQTKYLCKFLLNKYFLFINYYKNYFFFLVGEKISCPDKN